MVHREESTQYNEQAQVQETLMAAAGLISKLEESGEFVGPLFKEFCESNGIYGKAQEELWESAKLLNQTNEERIIMSSEHQTKSPAILELDDTVEGHSLLRSTEEDIPNPYGPDEAVVRGLGRGAYRGRHEDGRVITERADQLGAIIIRNRRAS